MSLYGALFTGVSGLQAQASKIGAISDNIANVNTVGYKQATVQFETLVVNDGFATTSSYSPGGVLASTRQEVDQQGLLLATSAPTDISISGDGFFVVNGRADGENIPQYTRAGSFRSDSFGNFVNASGFFLQGWPLDADGNIPATNANLDSLETVNVESATGDANSTTLVRVGANLDSEEVIFPGESARAGLDVVSAANFGITADEIILPSEFGAAPTNGITRLDQFNINTGNGLEHTYSYGGFTVGRNIATTVANAGDGTFDNQALTAIPATDISSGPNPGDAFINITLAGHGLVTGDTVTLAGIGAVDGIPGGEIDTIHNIVRIDENTFRINTITGAAAGGVNATGAAAADLRQFTGNVLDASAPAEAFLADSVSDFTESARSFTITTQTTGTVTFTYDPNSPSAVQGEFNNLNNLALAIDEVAGLTSRVQGGRLFVGSEDANEAVTFANSDTVGTSTLKGIDWISELDLSNIEVGERRFSNLQGLADIINQDTGVTAVVNNPLAEATLDIRVDDPLDTISFSDFVQDPVTRLANDPLEILPADATAAAGPVVVTVTDLGHDFQVGQNVTFVGSTGFGGITAPEINASHVVTAVLDDNTYQVTINSAAANPAVVGGGAVVDRVQTNNGSLLAELGLVPSLNNSPYIAQTTGILGPRYDTSGAIGENLASGDIEPQFQRSLRVFDSLGAPHDLQMGFIKVAENTWAVEIYAVDEGDVNSSLVDGQIATGVISFNGDGSLRSIDPSLSNPITVSWTNGSDPSEITFDLGNAGVPIGTENATVFGDTSGFSQFSADYDVNFVEQNGSQVGDLVAVSIGDDGVVSVSFSNGDIRDVYKLPVADFANPNGLGAVTGNVFQETRGSGTVNLREAGTGGTGTVVSSTLEASNVDLAEQLTDMIVAQRAYQSNTRSITTSDELLEELNRL